MKRRKLKRSALSFILVLAIAVSFFGIITAKNLISNSENENYSVPILEEVTESVISEVKDDKISKPFNSDKVSKTISYYKNDASDEEQTNSLIYYEKTYMPSTGILYSSEEEVDVLAIYKGKITNIKDDEVFGKVVEITHNSNFVTYYYSLKDINYKVGDSIDTGAVIGKSTSNKLSNDNSFFIECYYEGLSLNPEDVYVKKPNELQ